MLIIAAIKLENQFVPLKGHFRAMHLFEKCGFVKINFLIFLQKVSKNQYKN